MIDDGSDYPVAVVAQKTDFQYETETSWQAKIIMRIISVSFFCFSSVTTSKQWLQLPEPG
jgi:hypothetical protein